MVVEVNKIGFMEESGYFGLGVINRFIRIHAEDDFFFLSLPFADLQN